MTHSYVVTYSLTDAQDDKLRALTERFNKVMPSGNTPESLFEGLMLMGCAAEIDGRMEDLDGALFTAETQMGGRVP